MRPPLPHPAPDERGFILVGVVTFMLALTILGLSLFALSSYEAQFFVVSAAREQSLQNSESGMELVKALISAPGSDLGDAHRAEGQMGVTSAMAYQWRSNAINDTTSAGPVDWDSTVVIVVAAKSGNVERTLQARYIPGPAENPYQRLLAAGQGVTATTSDPTVLELTGHVWQPVSSNADTAWTQDVTWATGSPVQRGAPPMPMADAFIDANLPASSAPGASLGDHTSYEIDFVNASASPMFFHSPVSPTDNEADDDDEYSQYSFYVNSTLDIKVQGVAVWVVGTQGAGIPQGVCFKDRVRVKPFVSGVPSTLVIVAKANQQDPNGRNVGIRFMGGLKVSDGVQVYLVTQGDVSLVHGNNLNDSQQSNRALAASIVAGGRIRIGGPDSYYKFQFGYDPDSMDALADQLIAQGALPDVPGGTGASFVVMPRTWLETTPR